MANIWDPDRIDDNLQVLSNLFDEGSINKKLDIQTDGRLSIYKPVMFALQGIRRKNIPSITSEDGFKAPIVELFKKAKENNKKRKVIHNAIKGIESLRRSYQNKPAKINALEDLIRRINWAVAAFWMKPVLQDYQEFLTPYFFAQSQFLKSTNNGVCVGFTVLWMINKLQDKNWYYTMRYIMDHIGEIKAFQQNYDSPAKNKIRYANVLGWGNINLIRVIENSSRQVIEKENSMKIFENIIEVAQTCTPPQVFLIGLMGTKSHALGLDIRDGRIDIFDPNLGELRFSYSRIKEFYKFGYVAWYTLYEEEYGITKWELLKVV